ncbi:hypothetical protein DFH28DRAFT_1086136 [Melampsora americana]|nr:hypothetical protein DFH28DRAFT_1086136 [Melampsora americana]
MPRLPKDQKFFPNTKPKRNRDIEPDRHYIPHNRAVNLLHNLGIGPARVAEPPAEPDRHDEPEYNQNNQDDLNYDPRDDPPIPILDGAAERLAEAARAQYYAQKRLDFEQQWADLAALVTAVYLERQYATQNWTTSMSYLDNQPECNCNNQGTRLIDLIDIYGRISSYRFTFCKCCPDVIRLLYAGYFASSPFQPHTAFSIPLIQFHHRLWQTSALSTSSFIDALVAFLDDRSASPLYGQLRNGKISERELRKPLTQSIDLHRRILYHQERLYVEGLNLSSLEIYAQKCARCFGPREVVSFSFFNLKFILVLILLIVTAQWLVSKYQNALRVKDQASQGLSELYTQRNPHDPGREFYSAEFLKEQWTLERHAQVSKKHAEEKQRLELGRLLSLEEDIQQLWNSPVPTAEYELSRARRLNELQEKITMQQKKVGAHDVLALLTRVDGRTAVLATIRKHAVALSKAVDRYQDRLKAFRRQFPDRLAYPPEIEYATLFKIQPDDPFWSEGLFTNHSEPWAIDPSTQYGMRQLSYLERSKEEVRRIGWEV